MSRWDEWCPNLIPCAVFYGAQMNVRCYQPRLHRRFEQEPLARGVHYHLYRSQHYRPSMSLNLRDFECWPPRVSSTTEFHLRIIDWTDFFTPQIRTLLLE
jgi:hypothetical protein